MPEPLGPTDVQGKILGTVLVSGQLGVKGGAFGCKAGLYVGVGGVIGVISYSTGEWDVAGQVNAFGIIYYGIGELALNLKLLGPGIIASSEDLPKDKADEVKGLVDDTIGSISDLLDWVNGSWTGYIAENYRVGGDYSATLINGSLFIYYSYLRSDGSSWIKGYRIYADNRSALPIASPSIDAAAAISPFIFKNNNTLSILYGIVPRGKYTLDIISLLLQISTWNNGEWDKPVNLTSMGVVFSYSSDGEYVYAIWSRSFNYTNTRLLVFDLWENKILTNISIPNAYMIVDAYKGRVIVSLLNSSVAEINIDDKTVKIIENAKNAGYIRDQGKQYVFYKNNTLLIDGVEDDIVLPNNTIEAIPMYLDNELYIVSLETSAITVYKWMNKPVLTGNYSVANTTSYKPYAGNEQIYILPLMYNNIHDLTGDLALFIHREPTIKITYPPNGSRIGADKAEIKWEITPGTFNITRVEASLDDGEWVDVTGKQEYVFTDLAPGEHRITVRAINELNYEINSSIIIYVEHPIISTTTTTTSATIPTETTTTSTTTPTITTHPTATTTTHAAYTTTSTTHPIQPPSTETTLLTYIIAILAAITILQTIIYFYIIRHKRKP